MVKNHEVPRSDWQPNEKCSNLYSDSPFLVDDGVLKMGARATQGSFLPFELRFPVILPKKHPITRKLLELPSAGSARKCGDSGKRSPTASLAWTIAIRSRFDVDPKGVGSA